MVVIGARICGLIASVTRLVYFGKINSEVRRKHSAVVKVDANMINVSKPQAKVSEILKKQKKYIKKQVLQMNGSCIIKEEHRLCSAGL